MRVFGANVPTIRDVDGVLVIDWPEPRPRSFEISAEVFEWLIFRVNESSLASGSPEAEVEAAPSPAAPTSQSGSL